MIFLINSYNKFFHYCEKLANFLVRPIFDFDFFQGQNGIEFGDYTQISANVGIQSAKYNLYHLKDYKYFKPIKIGKYCLFAVNVKILPEVALGDFKLWAGAVVTQSFPERYCVIAGNPAKKLRYLNPSECIRYKDENEYIGFIKRKI